MLTESFIASTLTANKPVAHASAALKDVGVFLYEFQPQTTFRHGYKKSSSRPGCVAVSESHVFAAQADKAVINVYNRKQGNQEATVPFPERIHSLAYAEGAATLVLGTEEGRLICWEVATGRLTTSAAAHLQPVTSLVLTPNNEYIISASADSSVHVWSLLALLSFHQPQTDLGDESTTLSPLNTFSGHGTGVTAIACGHSSGSTNFAVSASSDQTCYIWHIETCQILRTILLPFEVSSLVLDPADRAIYFGGADGHVSSYDIFETSAKSKRSLQSSPSTTPIQLRGKDNWAAPDSELGSTQCLTLTFDGTALLSGHQSGAIFRWDVAKHRVLSEIANLGQPVTGLEMLTPEGFLNRHKAGFVVTNIVKPNLEFSAQTERGSLGIPAAYSLHAQIVSPNTDLGTSPGDDVLQALTGTGFPQSLIDDALCALVAGGSGNNLASNANADIGKVDSLEGEVAQLKKQIAIFQEVEARRNARKLERIQKREELGQKKREAYFAAQKKGKDGDAAMKKWEEKEAMLDIESDDEALGGDKMNIG